MEDYYKILEVNKDASPEIIEKVYKILVKKYHPDLQKGQAKIDAEEKIKKINQAYDVLSDPIKREEYDNLNFSSNISEENYNELIKENIRLKNELNYFKNNINATYANYSNNKYSNTTYKENYTNYYANPQKNSPYNKFDFKSFLKSFFSIFFTLVIVVICFNTPFINNLFYFLFDSDFTLLLIILLIIIIYKSKK